MPLAFEWQDDWQRVRLSNSNLRLDKVKTTAKDSVWRYGGTTNFSVSLSKRIDQNAIIELELLSDHKKITPDFLFQTMLSLMRFYNAFYRMMKRIACINVASWWNHLFKSLPQHQLRWIHDWHTNSGESTIDTPTLSLKYLGGDGYEVISLTSTKPAQVFFWKMMSHFL